MDTAELELRNQRDALLRAVNARDWKGVKTFMHPKVWAGGLGGTKLSYDFLIVIIRLSLMFASDFREELEIEKIEIEGSLANLTVIRTDSMKMLGLIPKKDVRRYSEVWEKVDGCWLMLSEDYHI